MLSDLPDGVSCFVDANIICYHIVQTPPLSDPCTQFIRRIESGLIRASTSSVVVAETIHANSQRFFFHFTLDRAAKSR